MYFVYMLASQRNGTLYIGVTRDLHRRVEQHRFNAIPGFTRKYHVHTLVWFEVFGRIDEAIAREKQLKGWNRAWKLRLIEKANPQWLDVANAIPYG